MCSFFFLFQPVTEGETNKEVKIHIFVVIFKFSRMENVSATLHLSQLQTNKTKHSSRGVKDGKCRI